MPVTMTVHEIARRIRVDLAEDDVTSDVYSTSSTSSNPRPMRLSDTPDRKLLTPTLTPVWCDSSGTCGIHQGAGVTPTSLARS